MDHLFQSGVPQEKNVSAAGLKLPADAGARTFGQNEETSVVYGMPRAASVLGAVQKQLGLNKIHPVLKNSFQRSRSGTLEASGARLW